MPERDHAAEAQEIRSRYARAIERVRADDRLSNTGKAHELARLHTETAEQLAEVHQDYRAALDREVTRLRRKAFGGPASIAEQASYRDALDRAERATSPDDALALLHRAEITGDKLLSQAVGTVASTRLGQPGGHWREVLHRATATDPDRATAIQDLTALVENTTSPQAKMEESMLFAAPSTPGETTLIDASSRGEG